MVAEYTKDEETKEYKKEEIEKLSKGISLEPKYGENTNRKNKKIIEIDGFLLYGVESIKVESTDVGCYISIVGKKNNIIARKELKSNLNIKKHQFTNTYEYACK